MTQHCDALFFLYAVHTAAAVDFFVPSLSLSASLLLPISIWLQKSFTSSSSTTSHFSLYCCCCCFIQFFFLSFMLHFDRSTLDRRLRRRRRSVVDKARRRSQATHSSSRRQTLIKFPSVPCATYRIISYHIQCTRRIEWIEGR